MNGQFRQLIWIGMLIALAALLAGCGGLSSEPRTVSTLIPPTDEPPTLAASTTTSAAPTETATTATTLQNGTQAVAAAAGTPASTAASTTAADVLGVVSGRIENHTKDGKVPPDTKLILHLINQDDTSAPEITFSADVKASGDYTFNDVPMRADLVYVVTTTYLDRQLSSDPVTAEASQNKLSIPVSIYEPTSDPQVVHVVSSITQVNADTSGLQVAQVIHLTNTSDRMFTGDKVLNSDHPGDKVFPSVSFPIPRGASLMGFGDTSGRFVTSADGTTITDTAPVLPGEDHVVHFIYTMPYKSDGTTIEQPLPYAVDGQAQVLVGPTAVSVTSDQLSSLGLQSKNGTDYGMYGGVLKLDAGKSLRFEVRGQLPAVASAAPVPSGPISRDLLIGLLIGGGFGLIGVGGAFLVYERIFASQSRKLQAHSAGEQETLVRQLAQLDEQYESGILSKTGYEKKRHTLKRRLARVMKQ